MSVEPEDVKKTNAIAGLMLFTSQLVAAMKTGKSTDVLTDEQLTEISGKNCRPGGDGYGYLQSAIRICERDYGVVWQRVRGADCIKCQTAEGVVEMSKAGIKSTYKRMRRSVRQLGTVSVGELSDDSRQAYYTQLCHAGTLANCASSSFRKKLAQRNISVPIEPLKLLEAMK